MSADNVSTAAPRRALLHYLEAGWTIPELARHLGLSRKTVSSIFRHSDQCTADTAHRICSSDVGLPPSLRRPVAADGPDFWIDDEPPAGMCARSGCAHPSGANGLGLCDEHNAAVVSGALGLISVADVA